MPEFSFLKEFDEDDVQLASAAVGAAPSEAGLALVGAWAFEAALGVLASASAKQEGATVGEVALRRRAALPARGPLHIRATLSGIWDLGAMALLRVHSAFSTPAGEDIADATLGFYLHGRGGFGGDRPPQPKRMPFPSRLPDTSAVIRIPADAAERYSLLGDRNAIHLDPAAAAAWPELTKGRPILHGLAGVAIVECSLAQLEAAAISSLRCRLSRPIWPGDALTLDVWREGKRRQLRLRRGDEDVWSVASAELE